MKTKTFFLLLSLLSIHVIGNNPGQKPKNKWKLVWQEEFNGNELDTTIWSRIPRGKSDWNNYMALHKELVEVKDGCVILKAVKNNTHPQDTATYLTGGIWTVDKKGFENGRIEVRAKFTSAQGYWPAIWMVPAPIPYPYGGEIDIMEHLNHDSFVYQTVHSHFTINLKKEGPQRFVQAKINPNEYNTYAVELYKDSIVYYTNGVKTLCYPKVNNGKDGQFPFAYDPFYLYLDSQLGGSWVGPVDPSQLPADMCIDWVRFYQRKKSN